MTRSVAVGRALDAPAGARPGSRAKEPGGLAPDADAARSRADDRSARPPEGGFLERYAAVRHVVRARRPALRRAARRPLRPHVVPGPPRLRHRGAGSYRAVPPTPRS